MTWMAVAIGGSAVIGAGASLYGSSQAAGAQGNAAQQNIKLQQQQMGVGLGLSAPARELGYGATSDLANLYGYSLSPYQSNNALMNGTAGGYGGGGPIHVNGRHGQDALFPGAGGLGGDFLGFGSEAKKYGGYIDPSKGTVSIPGQDERSQLATQYLRTGQLPGGRDKHPGLGRIIKQIDQMRAQGYQYDPNAATAAANFNPAAPGTPGNAGGQGQAGNMSRFFTSPDYQFRRDEGQRNIGNSFAARGGAASGNALRALSEFNGNLASGEFGNYRNGLLSMAGMGQVASNNAAGQLQAGTNNIMQQNTNAGDARASGIVSGITGASNAINSGMNNWMLYRGGYFNAPKGG